MTMNANKVRNGGMVAHGYDESAPVLREEDFRLQIADCGSNDPNKFEVRIMKKRGFSKIRNPKSEILIF